MLHTQAARRCCTTCAGLQQHGFRLIPQARVRALLCRLSNRKGARRRRRGRNVLDPRVVALGSHRVWVRVRDFFVQVQLRVQAAIVVPARPRHVQPGGAGPSGWRWACWSARQRVGCVQQAASCAVTVAAAAHWPAYAGSGVCPSNNPTASALRSLRHAWLDRPLQATQRWQRTPKHTGRRTLHASRTLHAARARARACMWCVFVCGV